MFVNSVNLYRDIMKENHQHLRQTALWPEKITLCLSYCNYTKCQQRPIYGNKLNGYGSQLQTSSHVFIRDATLQCFCEALTFSAFVRLMRGILLLLLLWYMSKGGNASIYLIGTLNKGYEGCGLVLNEPCFIYCI